MNFPLQLQTVTLHQQTVSLFVPNAEAVKTAYKSGAVAFPYWSKVWPAAIGLSNFLLRHPQLTQNKNVIEIGAGLGLPSLIAARNAASVLCTDVVPEAVEAVRQSATQNGFENLEAAVMDWQQLSGDLETDVLLLSDVNYEPQAFAHLRKMIEVFLKKRNVIVLSTPQRLMAKDFIAELLPYGTKQEEVETECDGVAVPVTVLVLKCG